MFCPLPWTHLGVKNNGTLRMCSHSQSGGNGNTVLTFNGKQLHIEDLDNVDVMNSDQLKEVRKKILNDEWPDQCRRCKFESKAGHRSRDQWETLRHIESFTKQDAINMTLPDGTVTNSLIQDMDLRVGNQCNLRCVMCFPGEATKWYKDYNEIIGENSFNVDGKTYTLIPSERDFDWVRSADKVKSLLNASKNLLKIKFGGGEPLMIKHHKQLIEGLIELGYSSKIELEYSSNVTVFPPELFDLWKHFKLVKICASVDAYGIANEAIRYPTNWDVVESNLRMLDETPDNIEVFTSTTISILSIEHYATLLLWLQNQRFKKINAKAYNVSASHPVYNPKYLNITILKEHEQSKLFEMLYKQVSHDSDLTQKIQFYDKYYQLLKEDNIEARTQLKQRFYRFAKNQKQDWDSIFPVISNLIKSWD